MKITINKTPFKFMLIVSAMLFFSLVSAAQVKPVLWTIAGKVIDSATKQSVGYATVRLRTIKNVPVKEVLADAGGTFTFSSIRPSQYVISFDASGYQNKTVAITDTAQTTINLPAIYMHMRVNGLKEVAITADKPIIKQEVDRITYDLQADPDSKGNNILQMLRKVPFVSVDGDDNIQVKGSTDFKIFINGKPSGMFTHDPKSILRSIPASTIQRIEVITTPPAKYDAEGQGGIINIITNKKIDAGYNGSVNLNNNSPGGPGVGTSFTIKDGKFGISGFGGGKIYNSPVTTSINTRNTTGASPTNLVQQGSNGNNGHSGYFGTELSYELDTLHLISGQFNINGDRSHGDAGQATVLSGPGGVINSYQLNNTNKNKGDGLDAGLNYQLDFKNDKSKLLTFSYQYSRYGNDNYAGIAATNRINYTVPDYEQDNNNASKEQTLQADYVQTLKKWNVELGVKGVFRNYDSYAQYNSYNTTTQQYDLVPALSNNFTGGQKIFAAYNSWQYGGKNWGIKTGIRIEQTTTDGNFISTASSVHQNYLNVIPSFSFKWDVDNISGFNLGFSQRLKRPGISKLNPFVDRSNPNFQSSGNPDLQRVLLNDLQLGYHINKKVSVNIGIIYDWVHDLDLSVSSFDELTNITYTTYKNEGSATGTGMFINANYPITKQWNFSLNSNVMYFTLTGEVNGIVQTINFWTASLSASTGYSFDKGWRVGANLFVNGRNPTGLQGSSKGFISTALNINKQVIKNKLSLAASLQNPFTKYRYRQTDTHGTDFTQSMVNQSYFRTGSISLNYNFGKLKGGIKKNKRGINNDD